MSDETGAKEVYVQSFPPAANGRFRTGAVDWVGGEETAGRSSLSGGPDR